MPQSNLRTMALLKIQTSIAGFAGRPVTLISVHDDETDILVVAKAVEYTESRIGDCVMVSNLPLSSVEVMFSDDDLCAAIRHYYARKSRDLLDLDDSLLRYEPENRIESDGVDERGRKYRISPEIDNGQLAVLATVAFVEKNASVRSALDMADDILSMFESI